VGYIYVITNTKNGKQYVGQTTYTPEQRWKMHVYSSKKDEGHAIHYAIRKHGESVFILETLQECANDVLDDAEIAWIERLGTYDRGYNETKGGRGPKGLKWTEERYESAAHAVVCYDPVSHEPIMSYRSLNEALRKTGTHINVAAACKGLIALSQGLIWKYADEPLTQDDIDRAKLRYTRVKRRVMQYTLEGELVTSYICAAEALRQTGIANIGVGCKKKNVQFGGFEGDPVTQKEVHEVRLAHRRGGYVGKAVQQLDENGDVIAQFRSCAAAARVLGLKQYQVARAANGHIKRLSTKFRFVEVESGNV